MIRNIGFVLTVPAAIAAIPWFMLGTVLFDGAAVVPAWWETIMIGLAVSIAIGGAFLSVSLFTD